MIDTVEYFDSAPWPTAPDGNGSYLQLVSTSLDNNLATSWIASNITLSTNNPNYNLGITIYPNPTNSDFRINAFANIEKIEIYDITGNLINTTSVNANNFQTNISSFAKGLYLLKIYTENGTQTEKLIKE